MNSIFGLMAASGGNFVSIAHLEIPLLIKRLMCQILIFPAVYTMNKLHEISHNVGKSNFYQFSNQWDQIVYTRCRIGPGWNKVLILGENPPCSLCRIPLSIKGPVLLDCDGFNCKNLFFFFLEIQLTLLKIF